MLLSIWICVQIIVESLPISSSGHVVVVQKLLEHFGFWQLSVAQLWEIDFLLHGPTIVIVAVYFFKQWWDMILPGYMIDFKILFRLTTWLALIPMIIFVSIVDSITIIFWWFDFAHYPCIQKYFLPIGFMVTAIILYAEYYASGRKKTQWSFGDALLLGVVQGISLLPGISRFASTYGAGRLLCGYNSSTAFAISFLIQFPLLVAGFFKGLMMIQKTPELMIKLFAFQSLFVMLIASLVSYGLLCLVGRLIEKNKLYYFARYMILPITVSLFLCKGI